MIENRVALHATWVNYSLLELIIRFILIMIDCLVIKLFSNHNLIFPVKVVRKVKESMYYISAFRLTSKLTQKTLEYTCRITGFCNFAYFHHFERYFAKLMQRSMIKYKTSGDLK